jgi:hypothetical protein
MKRASLLLRVKNGKTRRDLTSQPSQTYNGATNKLTGVNMEKKNNRLNEITELLKNTWGVNALEASVGLLSTLANNDQLDVLIAELKKEQNQYNAI